MFFVHFWPTLVFFLVCGALLGLVLLVDSIKTLDGKSKKRLSVSQARSACIDSLSREVPGIKFIPSEKNDMWPK